MWKIRVDHMVQLTVLGLLALMAFAGCTPDSDTGEPGAEVPTATVAAEPSATVAAEPSATAEGEPTGTVEDDGEAGGEELVGSQWNLVSMAGEPPVEDSTVSLDFQGEELGGVAGCNNYSAPYTLDGTSLSVGQPVSTMMACEGLMDQETLYLEMLTGAESISVEEDALTIHTSQGDLIYEPARHASLEGTQWTLSGIAQDGGMGSTAIDADITAIFENGTMAGSAGCNSYTADYSVEGDTLQLGTIISTQIACDDEERNEREALFLAALAETTAYDISRDTLRLTDGAGNDLIVFTARDSEL